MKKILILFLIMLLLISCSSDKAIKPDFDEQFTAEYSEKDLIPNISFRLYSNSGDTITFLSNIEEKFPNGVYRQFDNSLNYSIYKLKEGGYCYIFFEDIESKYKGVCQGAFVIKNYLSEAMFNDLELNSTLNDVISIDSGLEILLDYQEHSLLFSEPLKTFHLVENGFAEITYKLDEEKFKKENPDINMYKQKTQDKRNLYKYYYVDNVEFVENGDFLFEKAYPEKEIIEGNVVDTFRYEKYKTFLNPEDYPFE